MEEIRKRGKEEMDRDVAYSYAIKAGKRIYYMDVRKTRGDEMYLSITESKKIVNGEGDDAQTSFEKHKIFLYKEDFSKFIDGLSQVMRYIHDNQSAAPTPENETDAHAEGGQEPLDELKIEF